MVPQGAVRLMLLELLDRIPEPPPAARRGRPRAYSDRLFLKAPVLMIVRRLPKVHALLEVLVTLRLILHRGFAAKLHHWFTAKVHQGFTAEVHRG